MSLEQKIKSFYDKIQFPGNYTFEEIMYYVEYMDNPYMKCIHKNIKNYQTVIDLGCGTGAVTNFLSLANPNKEFLGIDFSKSIDFANIFSKKYKIKNVSYKQKDILEFSSKKTYDVVLCQGVLHHIPRYEIAVNKIKELVSPDGIVILGVYHPIGNYLKKYLNFRYKDKILEQDQTVNPFETYFTKKDVQRYFEEFEIISQYPKFFLNVFSKGKSTGLVIYVLKRKK